MWIVFILLQICNFKPSNRSCLDFSYRILSGKFPGDDFAAEFVEVSAAVSPWMLFEMFLRVLWLNSGSYIWHLQSLFLDSEQ